VNILVIASSYPYTGHPYAGSFNENSVIALSELCDVVQALVPRPYLPSSLSSLRPRWRSYREMPNQEVRSGVQVFRPAYLHIPRLGGAYWFDPVAFLCCRRIARAMHSRNQFDAIISFDLVGAGGLAWRMGRELGIPASGWATGSDIRSSPSSSYGRVVSRAIKNLDVVFYQSQELLEKATSLLGIPQGQLPPYGSHIVLSRGIPPPPPLPRLQIRNQIRTDLGFPDDQIVVLSVGRIFREKGVFEVLSAVAKASDKNKNIACVFLGSNPAFDETDALQKEINMYPGLKRAVRILSACSPDKVWDYLCAADIFAFASHKEGMPNSLLEAMAMGVPAIAFGIPPVLEINNRTGALLTVKPFDTELFSKAILHLASSEQARMQQGENGKKRVQSQFVIKKNMAKALNQLKELVAMSRSSKS